MSFKKALIWVVCFQMVFGNVTYAYDGDDGPDFDFSDEPFVVTPGSDRHEGRNDGNCTGSGCGERVGRGERNDDRDDDWSDRGDGGRGGRDRDDSRDDRSDYDKMDWQPFGEPTITDRNFKVVARRISSKDYTGAAGMVSVKDVHNNLYFRGKASRAYEREDGEYYTPDNRDIYFDRKGVPYVKSVDGKFLLNVDGLMECGPSNSCAALGYRVDWWNYSLQPFVDNSADAQAWIDISDFHKNSQLINKAIADSRAKKSQLSSAKEKVHNEVEFLSSEAIVAQQKGYTEKAIYLQSGALQLLQVVADVGVSLSPFGWAKDAYELVTGRSLTDGHVLSTTERLFAGIGVMSPMVGPLGYAGMRMISRSGRVASEAALFGRVSKLVENVVIETPTGLAKQEFSIEALKVKMALLDGDRQIFRVGTRGKNMTGSKAQYWSPKHPQMPEYGAKYGIPPSNYKNFDFIEVGRIKPGTSFVTRKAPGALGSPGGAIEVVVPEGTVIIDGHYSF